jgi:outer membrane lipoprotein carrier protein
VNRSHRTRTALALALSLELGAGALSAPRVVAQPRGPTQAEQATATTAEVVAARVQTFYDQTTTVQANFQQHFWNRAYDRTQSSHGTVSIQRPGRIRFDYTSPRGKVVVSTPEGFVYYEPGEDGSAGQYMRGSSEGASVALGFLTGTARLDRDFTLALLPTRAGAPANTDVLELTPRAADPHFRRVLLYVDQRAATAGVVQRVSIEDHDGNWNRFDFNRPRFNVELPASTFVFTPPSGAREMTAPTTGPARGRG